MVEFYCKECGKRRSYESINEIMKHKKICFECRFEKEKEAIKRRAKNAKKTILANKISICEICGKEFLSKTARTCSTECRTKLCEKTSFYNNLKVANRDIRISEIRVYGQGRYEKVNFIGDVK